ncbi:MAG: hypothetical protein K1X65_20940 [Caldilineales bacterium]|nr:hypothetical protein [Caldilineales bacterium]MCW5857545.1 hypothetical protein [Caldilineales bacterium]
MTLLEFRRALANALAEHFPQATLNCSENRGVVLSCRAEWGADVFMVAYFNALTQKTSYALIKDGERITGYDNYKFWHYHPIGAANQHIPCTKPTPEEVLAQFVIVVRQLGVERG